MNRRDFVTQSGAVLSAAGAARSPQAQARDVVRDCVPLPTTAVRRVQADGVDVFYREAGPSNAPVVLLVHGFPSSSFQYRELIPSASPGRRRRPEARPRSRLPGTSTQDPVGQTSWIPLMGDRKVPVELPALTVRVKEAPETCLKRM
jgi:hypothetical protein